MDLARCLEDLLRMLTPLPRLERTSFSIDCSPAPQRPSPSGRRVGSSEKLSRPAQGSLRFGLRTCTLVAPRSSPEASVGDLSPQLLQWLPDEPTILRTGLAPAGLRDPGGLSVNSTQLTSQISFRAALPGAYPCATPCSPSRACTPSGIDPPLIAGCLLGSLSQRLLRRLCEYCRAEAAPDENEARRLSLTPGDRGFCRPVAVKPAPALASGAGSASTSSSSPTKSWPTRSPTASPPTASAPPPAKGACAPSSTTRSPRRGRGWCANGDLRAVPYRILEAG